MPDPAPNDDPDNADARARRRAERLRASFAATTAAATAFLISAFSCIALYFYSTAAVEAMIREDLLHSARTAAGFVDSEAHRRFTSPDQETSAEYDRAVDPLRRVLQANQDYQFIYTCILAPGGEVRFVLDPTPPGDADGDGIEEKSHIYERYDGAPPQLIQALRTGKATADGRLYRDRWGTFISGYAPFQDARGRTVGVVGVDLSADKYLARRAGIRVAAVVGVGMAVALSALVGCATFFLQRRVQQGRRREEDARHALQESQACFHAVFAQSIDGIFLTDLETMRIREANASFLNLVGYSPEELAALTLYDLTVIDPEEIDASIRYIRKHGHNLHRERVYRLRNGSAVDVEISATIINYGAREALSIVVRDISQRKRTEIELRKLSRAVEQSPASIVITDPAGDIEYVNPKFVQISGYSVAEVLGQNPRILKGGNKPHSEYVAMWETILSGQEWRGEFLNRRKDGTLFWESASISALMDADGKVTDIVAVKEDITARKAAEEALRRAHEELEQRVAERTAELARTNEALHRAYDATIEGWSRALDLRDEETHGHSRRVTEMTLALARALGIDDEELAYIRYGALLHDIGKLGVPDAILRKPGRLTEDEWRIMRRHPGLAVEMLWPVEFLRPALDIPYCHHEKWDGSGYPRGLVGEEIPLAARLFAVVDVWDALRSDRPYRDGWPRRRVIEHIRSLSGSHFEPRIVAAFLDMVECRDDAEPEESLRAAA